jgi:hypothetical protein
MSAGQFAAAGVARNDTNPVDAVKEAANTIENGINESSNNADGIIDTAIDVPPFGHEHFSQRAPWLRAAVLGANVCVEIVDLMKLGWSREHSVTPSWC